MKQIARKAVPLACVIAAPFCLSADEQSDAVLAAASKPVFSSPKVASAHKGNGSNSAKSGQQNYITPPAGPSVSDGPDVYVTADFIYWKPTASGLEFAFTGGVPGGGYNSLTNAEKGKMYAPNFEYKPGFKVALGVLSNHDNWDFVAEYTWLNVNKSSTSRVAAESSPGTLQGTKVFSYLGIAPVYSEAEGLWGMKFNVLDFEWGRKFYLSKCLTARPHAGMKLSWVDQEYAILGKDLNTNGASTADNFAYYNKQDQFGVGIRAGMDTSWHLSNKFSIYGDWALTGMLNYFDAERKDVFYDSTSGDHYTNANVENKPRDVNMVLELGLGLRFETLFNQGKYMYMLQAGWETQVWFDQVRFINFQSEGPSNLSMQGLTVKTGFWF